MCRKQNAITYFLYYIAVPVLDDLKLIIFILKGLINKAYNMVLFIKCKHKETVITMSKFILK